MVSVYAGRKPVPQIEVSRDLVSILFIFLNSYISILSCPIFRRARFPSQAPPRCTTIFLGTRRTHHPTLQVTIVGPPGSRCSLSRGETESLVATSRRHLQDPTLHYAFPHTCSCHQHVTAWTSTRLSWREYVDDIWSVTSGCRSARTPVFVRFASVRVLEASVIFRKAFDLPPHSFLPLEHFRSYGNWQQTTTHIAT